MDIDLGRRGRFRGFPTILLAATAFATSLPPSIDAAAAGGGAIPAPSSGWTGGGGDRARGSVDEIVVLVRHDSVPLGAREPSPGMLAAFARAVDGDVVPMGRTRDGAFRLRVDPPLTHAKALKALNAIRMYRYVLYAEPAHRRAKAGGGAVKPAQGRPTDALIVKLREPGLVQRSRLGAAPDAADVRRLATLAGQALAFRTSTYDGAHVLATLRKLPVAEMEDVARAIAQDPLVEYAEPDYVVTLDFTPNDPLFAPYQWNLRDTIAGIHLPLAWDRTRGRRGIVTAVVDTGILFHHDLVGNLVRGWDFIRSLTAAGDGDGLDDDPWDEGDGTAANECFIGDTLHNSSWHGTFVGGILVARTNNSYLISGIAGGSSVQPVRAFGKCGGVLSDIVDAIVWAAGLPVAGVPPNPTPARVINLSHGFPSATCPLSLQNAINEALAMGASISVSAGNGNVDAGGQSPANCSGVVTVTAVGSAAQRATPSNFGQAVDVAAPGGHATAFDDHVFGLSNSGTKTPIVPGGYNLVPRTGTSVAAPHAAGVMALMLSLNPGLTPAQVTALLTGNTRPFPPGSDCSSTYPPPVGKYYCGTGMLDAYLAVDATPRRKRRDPDFNGDGLADLLQHNPVVGNRVTLSLGLTMDTPVDQRVVPWKAIKVGDFDGDGKTDIVYRRPSDGQVDVALMNGVTETASGTLFISLTKVPKFTADFNCDGKDDLLIHDSANGATQLYLMNGTTTLVPPITLFTEQSAAVIEVGDFNSDCRADIVIRDPASGAITIRLQDGGTVLDSATLLTDVNRTVDVLGDFNGDGKSDLILLDATTGATEIRIMNGVEVVATVPLLDGGFWQVALADDFDADGRTDILWRHATMGALAQWYMDGVDLIRACPTMSVDPRWRVATSTDLEGDGRADLILEDVGSGQSQAWHMNGCDVTAIHPLADVGWWIN